MSFFKKIVEICNTNAGFISAILTIVTIFLTTKLSLLPFKNKLFINLYGAIEDSDTFVLNITVSNTGNAPTKINELEVLVKNEHFDSFVPPNRKSVLLPLETKEYYMKFDNDIIKQLDINIKTLIIVKTTKKKYKIKYDWAVG